MSLILCPECNAMISDKAFSCPHCGYVPNNRDLPISVQQNCTPIPKFKYSIQDSDLISLESMNDNKELFDFFGNPVEIYAAMPGIAEVIYSLGERDQVLTAKIPQYIKKLIDNGTYRFAVDKNGEILPSIVGPKGIVKQVRLERATLQSPSLLHSLSNLSVQIMMTQILSKIESIENSITTIQFEMQNDRLALFDSAMQSIQQAFLMKNMSLRNDAILDCIHRATEAKCTLMRNYSTNYKNLRKTQNQGLLDSVFKKDTSSEVANNAKNDLICIMYSTRIECMGYGALGEYESGRKCLSQLNSFVSENKLTDKSVLRLINEGLETKETHFVENFAAISKQISNLEEVNLLDNKENVLLMEENKNGRY